MKFFMSADFSCVSMCRALISWIVVRILVIITMRCSSIVFDIDRFAIHFQRDQSRGDGEGIVIVIAVVVCTRISISNSTITTSSTTIPRR